MRNFSRQKLAPGVRGPVTVVSGRRQRLTLIECSNDINVMVDVAKVADLALVLVDAAFGFEMEVFEFLDVCRVHGFPKIMGVLTHLDGFKSTKALQRRKKELKHRFWTEVYQGAKLFYLSGISRGEEYPKTEVIPIKTSFNLEILVCKANYFSPTGPQSRSFHLCNALPPSQVARGTSLLVGGSPGGPHPRRGHQTECQV